MSPNDRTKSHPGAGDAQYAGSAQEPHAGGNSYDVRQNAQHYNSFVNQLNESNRFKDFSFQLSSQVMNQPPSQSLNINSLGAQPQLEITDNHVANTLASTQPLLANYASSNTEVMHYNFDANVPMQNKRSVINNMACCGFGGVFGTSDTAAFGSTNYISSNTNYAVAQVNHPTDGSHIWMHASAPGDTLDCTQDTFSFGGVDGFGRGVTEEHLARINQPAVSQPFALQGLGNVSYQNHCSSLGYYNQADALFTSELLGLNSGSGTFAPNSAFASAFNSSVVSGAQMTPMVAGEYSLVADAAQTSIPLKSEETQLLLPKKVNSCERTKETFALKLMRILSTEECQGAIRWTPAGDAFCIVNEKELVEEILSKYFKETKFTSFVSLSVCENA